jgi:hypothetical protein
MQPDEGGAGTGPAAGKGERAREAAEAAKLEGNAAVATGDFEAAAEVRGGLELWQGPAWSSWGFASCMWAIVKVVRLCSSTNARWSLLCNGA